MSNPEHAIRRIVTGHDADGRARIVMDGPAPNQQIRGYGSVSTLIWSSDKMPVEVWTGEDFGARENIIQPPRCGSGFRIVEFPPGTPGRMHRTDTLDYAICMTGEIDMELDDGLTVHMKRGDVMVQQGTNHSWINKGSESCRVAFALIDAKTQAGGALGGPGAQPLAPLRDLPPEVKIVAPPIRRIVTTHDADGKAIIMSDGPAPRREGRGRGNISTLIWGSDETPANIRGAEDYGLRDNEIEPAPSGSWCRVIDYPPGMTGRMHRTDTVDYVICVDGEIDMQLDDGEMVHMGAGDVMVQQATNHSWINDSDQTCRIVFVLLDAKRKS
jgi:quercetin dioxygenase-like cupin family protein